MELIDELNSYQTQYILDTLETRNLFTQLWADLKNNMISHEELENKLNYLKDNSHKGLFDELINNVEIVEFILQQKLFDHIIVFLKFGIVPDIRQLLTTFQYMQISDMEVQFPEFYSNTNKKKQYLKKIMYIVKYILENREEYTAEILFWLFLKHIQEKYILKACSLIKNKDLIFRSLANSGPSVKQINIVIQYLNDNKFYVDINKMYDNSDYNDNRYYPFYKTNIAANIMNPVLKGDIDIIEKYIDSYIIDPTIVIQLDKEGPEKTVIDIINKCINEAKIDSLDIGYINKLKPLSEKIIYKYNIHKVIIENIPMPIEEEITPEI